MLQLRQRQRFFAFCSHLVEFCAHLRIVGQQTRVKIFHKSQETILTLKSAAKDLT